MQAIRYSSFQLHSIYHNPIIFASEKAVSLRETAFLLRLFCYFPNMMLLMLSKKGLSIQY